MRRRATLILCIVVAAAAAFAAVRVTPVRADAADEWWDEAWPYRVPVTVATAGVAQAPLDFGAALSALGLGGEILDVRSIRVVAYAGGSPAGTQGRW